MNHCSRLAPVTPTTRPRKDPAAMPPIIAEQSNAHSGVRSPAETARARTTTPPEGTLLITNSFARDGGYVGRRGHGVRLDHRAKRG